MSGYSAVYPSPSKPRQVSRKLAADVFTDSDGALTLRYWRGDWWLYTGTSFQKVTEDEEWREPIWDRLEEVGYEKDDELVPWIPTTGKLNNLVEPLRIETRIPRNFNAPMIVNGRSVPRPAPGIIAMNNGLFNLETSEISPATAQVFTTWSLPFDYDENATCPRWEKFIEETYAHDPAAVNTIQELFGYFVSGSSDRQIGWLLLGPSGSGKGVQTRVLTALMGGDNNVAAGSFDKISNRFGLADWVDKPLVIFGDSRDNGVINATATSTLLSVIGQDAVPVEGKGTDIVTVTLPTRVVIVSNEMPSFRDSSRAIIKRWIITETRVGVRGTAAEDPELTNDLEKELPGIFNWSLRGLARLNRLGKFTSPEASVETREMMDDAAAPEVQFIEDNYRLTNNDEFVWLDLVYAAYCSWMENRRLSPVSQNKFKSRLKAGGLPEVVLSKAENAQGKRQEVIKGISWVKTPN